MGKIIVLILVVVVAVGGYYYFTDRSEVGGDLAPDVLSNVQEYFNDELSSGTIERVGQPIEGFVPVMFMEAFPGLVPSDFSGVEAQLGVYKLSNGGVAFVLDDVDIIHSAADAISEAGMKTLLLNVADRTGVNIENISDIDELIELISK